MNAIWRVSTRCLVVCACMSLALLGVTSSVLAKGESPPPGSTSINSPKLGATLVAMLTSGHDSSGNPGLFASVAVLGKCQGKDFSLGAISVAVTDQAEFDTLTSKAVLEGPTSDPLDGTSLGRTAPAGCFSPAGGEGLVIESVIKYLAQTSSVVIADVIIGGYN